MHSQSVTMVLGAQWGDEGKGKLVDILSSTHDIVLRATGGANAGHSVYVETPTGVEKYVFHLLPSGLLYPHVQCLIGNGVVLHGQSYLEEMTKLEARGVEVRSRVKLSERLHLLFDFHKIIDGLQEDAKGDKKVGTTKRGIGPCYAEKVERRGVRLCELRNWDRFEEKYRANLAHHQEVYGFEYDPSEELAFYREHLELFLSQMSDGLHFIREALASNKKILVEGANATLLDIDHGTYPFVTSSSPSIGGIFTGTSLSPKAPYHAIGVVKAYMTRVGAGAFPTELTDDLGEKIRATGNEYGSTTGRPRRCGWFDAFASKYAIDVNGFHSLNLTKLDVLSDLSEIKICTGYQLDGQALSSFPCDNESLEKVELSWITLPGWNCDISHARSFEDLPAEAQAYVLKLEELLETPISSIGVGPRRDQIVWKG